MNYSVNFLQVENLTKSFGDLLLFQNISFAIEKEQKIALVARNGAGKSTLLNIICSIDSADEGKISLRNSITFAYLQQSYEFRENESIIDFLFNSSDEIFQAVKDYELALFSNDKTKIDIATSKMDALAAWNFEAKAKTILGKLDIHDINQKIIHLSGGTKKRIALASVLLKNADLLILDEPTNHLDMEAIEWLEDFLVNAKATILMVTHDRYFLDKVCNKIIELDNKKTFEYKGNYSYYLEKSQERILSENTSIERAKSIYHTELEWIRRMPTARGTKAKSRVQAFYELQEVATRKTQKNEIEINIKSSRIGKKIIDLFYVTKRYDQKTCLNEFTYKFAKGEKIGIVGKNGCGKTTLLNLITGNLKPDSGRIEIGETIIFGHYKQEGIKFDENKRIIEAIREIADVVQMNDGRKLTASQFLNYFLFPNEIQQFYISKLSGGEKRRLYLATVLMQNPNFLILDEPTNDLDILTLNILEDYLQKFTGCVLAVSHDRYFLDKVCDHIFVFGENGNIKDFPGNYTDYRLFRDKKNKENKKLNTKNQVKNDTREKESKVKFSYKYQLEFQKLEQDIEKLNQQKTELETNISSGTLNHELITEKSKEYSILLNILNEKENRWLELLEMQEESNN